MANVAEVLKKEIVRLARKEARTLTVSVHKAATRFRKDIAALKRENARARADIARLVRQMPVGVIPRVTEIEPSKVRYSAASVAAQRKRLDLSAADFGKLIGVSGQTVYSWEQGKSRPRDAQIAAFAGLRGIGKREAGERLEEIRKAATKGQKRARSR